MSNYQNMALSDLSGVLNADLSTVTEWATLGMPECSGLAGTYDMVACLYWRLGHNIHESLSDNIRGKVKLTVAQKVAAGWLLSPGPETTNRRDDIAVYLNNAERSGILMKEALAALHFAMGVFDALGLYPGRVMREDGKGGKGVSMH
jgi:hypothetical protein